VFGRAFVQRSPIPSVNSASASRRLGMICSAPRCITALPSSVPSPWSSRGTRYGKRDQVEGGRSVLGETTRGRPGLGHRVFLVVDPVLGRPRPL
jgi:hypothetical protein